MSIVRISYVKDTLYKVDADGKLQPTERLGTVTDPTEAFGQLKELNAHLDSELMIGSEKLDQEQPAVVMVHGFWYDPADEPKASANPVGPHSSNNPHLRNFHFEKDVPKPHWRHTRGWPLGLGFSPNDRGANGLVIAYGWDSTPSALKAGGHSEAVLDFLSTVATKGETETGREEMVKDLDAARTALETLTSNDTARHLVASFKKCADALNKSNKFERARALVSATPGLKEAIGTALKDTGKEIVPLVDLLAKYTPEVYAAAYKSAEKAASGLAAVLFALTSNVQLKDRPIDIFCHSLGSRVVLRALQQISKIKPDMLDPEKGISRVLILGGAEYRKPAQDALNDVLRPQGAGPTFYNFVGRRDRVLTKIAGDYNPIGGEPRNKEPIGCYGLGNRMMNGGHWIDIQLDTDADGSHALNKWLKSKGHDLTVAATPKAVADENGTKGPDPMGVLNHWSYYANDGNLKLFGLILRKRKDWAVPQLRKEEPPIPEVK